MNNYKERLENAKQAIKEADCLLIGAGAGLSNAAGFDYASNEYKSNFSDYVDKYHFNDLYTSCFYRFESEEEYWAYWARFIYVSRYEKRINKVYNKIKELVKYKKYFILTTNVDYMFQNNLIENDNVFMIQGDYGYIQCAKACHDTIYYNEDLINEMLGQTTDFRIPTELVPKCPKCNGKMVVHIHSDKSFVKDQSWNYSYNKFLKYYENIKDKKVVLIELGVGFSTPDIIRYPFEELVSLRKDAKLIRMNKDFPNSKDNIKHKTISFTEDISEVLTDLIV